MLESVGFRYSHRIDPFDGGPHFEARTDEIHSVAASTRRRVSREVLDDAEEQAFLARRDHPRLERAVVGTGRIEGPTRFRAAVVGVDPSRPEVALSGGCRKRLGVRTGGEVWVVTL